MTQREPLYRDVKQQLTDALRSGKWKHGQKIASEPQLAERFGVSVGTVRKAIGELEAENILVREQGRGTFVVSHTRDYMLNVFFRIVDADGQKELPTVALLGMKRGRADRSTAALLKLTPRAPVIDIEALLSLKGRPTILDRIRLPAQLFGELGEHLFKRRLGNDLRPLPGALRHHRGPRRRAHHRRRRRRARRPPARRRAAARRCCASSAWPTPTRTWRWTRACAWSTRRATPT